MFPRPALALAALLLAGCAPAPASPTAPAEPELVASSDDAVTLLAPAALDTPARQVWTRRIRTAVDTLAQTDLGPLDDGWDGRLVVELPDTARAYARLAGEGAEAAAAVTRCPADGSRITVNPVVDAAEPAYLASLLLHEAVHVATGSSCSVGAPQWVEEGLAEWVAAEHSGESLAANQAWVEQYLELHGIPEVLPTDADFSGDPDTVSAAYGLARLAVAAAIDGLGHDAAMEFFGAAFDGRGDDATTAAVTGWYRAELAGLSASARR
ncbi:MAG: hypothetical protein REI45_06375 [Propionicimonas sp.]|nr:hypothetical protein [Propionicimonas sp.]